MRDEGSHAMAPSRIFEGPGGRTVRGQTVDGPADGVDAAGVLVERMESDVVGEEDRESVREEEAVSKALGNSAMVLGKGLPAGDVSVREVHLPS